jgi:hypothetical protein
MESTKKRTRKVAAPKRKRNTLGISSARKCTDETGHIYDSMLEMDVTHEFESYAKQGLIANLQKQVVFSFDRINFHGVFKGNYTADFTFDCKKSFSVPYIKKVKGKWVELTMTFESGKSYVIDVKSPKTYCMPLWRFKKRLMKSVWGVAVVELVRRHPKKKPIRSRKTS